MFSSLNLSDSAVALRYSPLAFTTSNIQSRYSTGTLSYLSLPLHRQSSLRHRFAQGLPYALLRVIKY